MRLLVAALLAILSLPAHALTTAEVRSLVCTGSSVNQKLLCGGTVASASFDILSEQISASTNDPVSTDAPLLVTFVETSDTDPARSFYFSASAIRVNALTNTVTTPVGVPGRLCMVQMVDFALGEPVCTGEFTRTNGTGSAVKFNPGHYSSRNYVTENTINNPALLENMLIASGVCVPGSQWNVFFPFNWGEYEPNVGNYKGQELIDWALNHFSSGDCRGTANPPRIGVSVRFSTFGGNAFNASGGPLCVPQDQLAWGLSWTKTTSNNGRCIARIWDQPAWTVAFDDMLTATAQRYNEHPLFEWMNTKDEGSLSIGQSGDASYLANQEVINQQYRDEVRAQATLWRSVAPNTAFTIGSNYFNSTDPVVIQARADAQAAHLDATGGLGLQWPDSFSDANGAEKPRTNTQARIPGWVASATSPRQHLYMIVANTQRWTQTTCGGDEQGCYDFMSKPGFVFSNNNNPAAYVPAQGATNYTGGAASHSIWLVQFAAPDDRAAIEAVLNAEGWAQWQETCPKSWTDLGLTCVTGGI